MTKKYKKAQQMMMITIVLVLLLLGILAYTLGKSGTEAKNQLTCENKGKCVDKDNLRSACPHLQINEDFSCPEESQVCCLGFT